MKSAKKAIACQDKIYEITSRDLPLCCPMPAMELWDAHPRIYLPIDETGCEVCPYCGSKFILKDFVSHKSEITTAVE